MVGMNWPEQWQVVIIMPSRYCFTLLSQRRDTALLGEQFSYLPPECSVAAFCLFGFQNLAKNADQGLLSSTVLIVKSRQMLLRQSLGLSNAAKHHLDQFITAAHARLAQQREQQRLLLSSLRDVAHISYVERRGFRSKLPQFGVGDTLQQRIGIDQASQPSKPVNPHPDGGRGGGPRRLLQAIKPSRHAIFWSDQQGVEHRTVRHRDAGQNPIVDPCMDFGTQVVHEAVKCAESWQVY